MVHCHLPSYFFVSRRVGYVMDGWFSGRCMYVTPIILHLLLTPIKFTVVKVTGMREDLIPIQFRTAIFILL